MVFRTCWHALQKAQQSVRYIGLGTAAVATRWVARPKKITLAEDEGDVDADAVADAAFDDELENSLESMAREAEEGSEDANKVKALVAYQDLDHLTGTTYVDSFDGIRLILQKNIGLNNVVTHQYILGSSQMPPFYQYGLILHDPLEGTQLHVNTADLQNIQYNATATHEQISIRMEGSMTEKGNTNITKLNYSDKNSVTQIQYGFDPERLGGYMFAMNFMQNLTNNFSLGGQCMYAAGPGALMNSFGGVYNDGENSVAAEYGGLVSILFQALLFFSQHTVSPSRY
jgi:hypothetical protein